MKTTKNKIKEKFLSSNDNLVLKKKKIVLPSYLKCSENS